MNNAKILRYEDIQNHTQRIESRGVLVGGCFDIFHFGHFTFLSQAKQKNLKLVVALESDEFIKKNKKRAPFHNQEQRAAILAGLEFVDSVVLLPYLQSFDDYKNLVQTINPSVIVITEGDPQLDNKQEHAKLVDATLKTIPLLPNFSSSELRSYAPLSRN